MAAVDLGDPQTLNLYSYCGNDPVNHTDPDGLFFKKLFKGIWKVLTNKWFILAVTVALAVLTSGLLGPLTSKSLVWVAHGALKYPAIATKLTALGWTALGISAALALPTVVDFSWQGILQRGLSYGIGSAVGSVSTAIGAGTPEWNPDANDFALRVRRQNRRNRRGSPFSVD